MRSPLELSPKMQKTPLTTADFRFMVKERLSLTADKAFLGPLVALQENRRDASEIHKKADFL